ncbi:MAG: AAA family ATPase [Holophagales bacterium]|jgi:predicted ATPase|nr:AAA family ATPase [Holophagales bacterium]
MQTLKKIEIKGFKSIENAELTLENLNVVIGANGSGKSNLMGAFKLLEQYASNCLKVHVADESDHFLHHGSKTTPEISVKLFFEGETFSVSLKNERSSLVVVEDSQKSVRDIAQKWVAYHFDDTSDLSPAKRIADLHDNRWLRHDAANLPAFLYWMQEKEPISFRMIEEHVRLVAPFFDRFVLAPHHLNENKIKLEWRQKGSNAYFNAYSLSSGTLRFICLAALLLQPEPPPLILLDEPELGLHPFAIRVLAEMLDAAATRSQVIATTQSVTLLNHFGPNDVIVAEHDGSKTTFNRLDSEKLKGWLEEYSLGELWEKNVLGGRP